MNVRQWWRNSGMTLMIILFAGCTVHANSSNIFLEKKDDFKVKGFHLDLRIQVMKMPALRQFAQKLSENGINTLVMEWEATYPYDTHTVISNRYAYSREEVTSFVQYCDSLGIDVIPLQQSFGHVEYILKHYRYKDLREDPKDYSQVNPTKEDQCKLLFADLYRDMISTHNSSYIHIGGDETYLLGHSAASKAKADSLGMGRLYGDYIKMLCELVVSLGKRPVVWADIALKYPEALEQLPKETVFVDWNYGWDLDRFGDHKKLMESGFEIWGSPAIRSYPDNYFLTDWAKHLANVRDFVPQARDLGYQGMVMTSWSTSGIYSSIAESHSDFIELHAIRRVYPISGFQMLVDAFFNGMENIGSFDPDRFAIGYAKDKYGLSNQDAERFWNALKITPYEVNQGKVANSNISLAQLTDSAALSLEVLQSTPVKENQREFKHYVLMANIRYNYLVCISVEAEMNLGKYSVTKAEHLLQILKSLNTEEVDHMFQQLNADLMYDEEIELETKLRNYRYDELIAKLETHRLL